MDVQHITANGLDFAYVADGPADGPLALCLHGFPDTAHTWRYLVPALAAEGYRAVAPWLRGYAPTAVPAQARYDIGTLGLDAIALHEALGGDSDAVLIGHDWGAMISYAASAHAPHRWRKVVTAAVPPQRSMGDAFFSFDQLRRSWYIFVFQTLLAEYAVSKDDYAFLDGLWATWSPVYDGTWDAAQVKEALASPESLTAAITYYRTMLGGGEMDAESQAAQAAADTTAPQPTLYLHGADDGCLGLEIIGPVTDYLAEGSELVIVEGAGHFLHVERPDVVNEHVLRFLAT